MADTLTLTMVPGRLAICRLAAGDPIPAQAVLGNFFSVTRTVEELSIVCPEALAPAGSQVEGGWRALKVAGPLDFALTGILAGLSGALAGAGISLFAISTYDTDYVLVRATDLDGAIAALKAGGYGVESESSAIIET